MHNGDANVPDRYHRYLFYLFLIDMAKCSIKKSNNVLIGYVDEVIAEKHINTVTFNVNKIGGLPVSKKSRYCMQFVIFRSFVLLFVSLVGDFVFRIGPLKVVVYRSVSYVLFLNY